MARRRRVVCVVLWGAAIMTAASASAETIVVVPAPYPRALRNPLKGFTTLNARTGHEWATLAHHYIKWNEIEDRESDGIDRIREFCDVKWKGFAEKNVKVIPRVYLHWSGDQKKFWPSDMKTDDYTSPQFQKRVVRLVKRLGEVWDEDPRVAFVELGIFGKWGEHHTPSPTPEMQELVGAAFRKAFRHKHVSVRHAWKEFTPFEFGEYWDSWAHYQQVWAHGKPLHDLNVETGRWRKTYIGGETAYDWGLWKTQPGDDATDSVSDPAHRDFVIDTVRWLHCTQLRWIGNYDARDPKAREGAEFLQLALGYRFVLEEVSFTPRIGGRVKLAVSFKVRNTGAAPFYYKWPVEVALLESRSKEVVWKDTFNDVDIRTWLPGDGWTEPEWIAIDQWPKKAPKATWSDAPRGWMSRPRQYRVSQDFKPVVPRGRYVLTLAILDPAGMRPCVRFATANYLKGGRHAMGIVTSGTFGGGKLPAGFQLDDPHEDMSLGYLVR